MKKLKRQLGMALMLILSIHLISINSNKIKSKEVDKIYGQLDNSNQDWSFLNYYYSNNFSEGNSIKENFNSMNDSESISPITSSTNSLMNSLNLENSQQSLSNSDSNFSGQDYNMQNFNYETKPISPTEIPKGFVTPKIESEYSTTQGIYGDTALVNNIRIGASRVPNSNSSTPGSSSTTSHVSYSALISDSPSQANGNEEFKNLIYNTGNGNSVSGLSKNKSNSTSSSSIGSSSSEKKIKI